MPNAAVAAAPRAGETSTAPSSVKLTKPASKSASERPPLKIALRELLEKGFGAGFLREMIGVAAERLMALETESLCGGAPSERTPKRQNLRNGYRDRGYGRMRNFAHTQARGAAFTSPGSAGGRCGCSTPRARRSI